ncbi:MAG: protein-glutamate O-methyltransferase CheR [Isosphaeraceae bacterium]
MKLDPSTFDELRRAIYSLCGIVVTNDKHYLIVTRLEPILKRHALPTYESLAQGLRMGNPTLQQDVVEAITTKETSFNRDGHPFDELRRTILPEFANRALERKAQGLLASARTRIWCAAVATGQEAYSVAMAVADFLATRPGIALTQDDFPILATDISQNALAVAREGRYTLAELGRGLTPEQRTRYFRPVDGYWVVDDALRRSIELRRLNLVQAIPNMGAFDIILCRNVLIYFDEAARRRLLDGFYQALNPGGILIIGAAESIYGISDAFTTERVGNTFVQRKR